MLRSTAIALTVLIGLTGCTTPESAPAPSPAQQPDGLDALARQQLKWAECENADLKDGGAECATVEVPMDYRDPSGKKITVAIARKQAGDKARRRGVLLTNPGGPGAEGLSLALGLEGQPAAAVYDTIGMDPRGVGKSTQLFCDPQPESPTLPSRPTEDDLAKYTEHAKGDEAACAAGGGDLRKHITSMNTARDMDLIRRVLGEEKISFLGFSYGTFLGPLYGEMFAEHLDRIVLDSTQDPNQSWRDQEKDDVAAHHANVQAWKQWVADRDKSFHLGATPADVQGVLDRFAATLKDKQLGELDDVTSFDSAVGTGARYRSLWAAFAWALGDLLPALDGGDIDAAAAGQLAKLAHPDEGNSLRQDEKPNGTYQAILCDWSWPTNQEDYYADMRKVAAETPYGEAVNSVAPNNCSFTSGRDPMIEIKDRRYQPGVVVQAEGDTQTAYRGGTAAADKLDMPLITVQNSGVHGHYGARKNACVDDAVNAYLIDGKLPERRTTCAAVADKLADIAPDSAGGEPAKKGDSPSLVDLLKNVK